MSYPTDRVQLFDRNMTPLPELAPNDVFSRIRTEELNGEHELVIATSRRLEEGWRALTVDGTGKWREWVVTEIDEEHASGAHAIGTYRLVWSLQYDLTLNYSHTENEVGMGSTTTCQQAADIVLEGCTKWARGTCDGPSITNGTGCVMIYESAWSRLSKLVDVSKYEVDAEIEVSNYANVTARRLALRAHLGSDSPTRRFDWGADTIDIRRTPDPGPYYCRIVPLGKGETEYATDDETTFEWPLDITDETGDPDLYYIEDAEAVQVFRISDGHGGWIYPTKAVEYDEDDPELLLNAGQADLLNHTRPNVTYEANVLQFEQAGMDAHGVTLGDEIQIVDHGFNPDAPLRIQGRVTSIEVDELNPAAGTVITIGNLRDTMGNYFDELDKSLANLTEKNTEIYNNVSEMSTASYVRNLVGRINTEINATGGYTYIVPGEGTVTYDVAVADPLIGSEATRVVQIKGGSIRIADTKNPGFQGIDDWDWKTVFVSGHILSDLITAVKITSGYIGDATNSNFWNLDTGDFNLRMRGRGHYYDPTYYDPIFDRRVTTKHGVVSGYSEILIGDPVTNYPSDVHGLKISEELYDTSESDWVEQGAVLVVPTPYSNTATSTHSWVEDTSGSWCSIATAGNLHLLSNYQETYLSHTTSGQLWLHDGFAKFGVGGSRFSDLFTSSYKVRPRTEIHATTNSIKFLAEQSSSPYERSLTLDDSGLSLSRYTPLSVISYFTAKNFRDQTGENLIETISKQRYQSSSYDSTVHIKSLNVGTVYSENDPESGLIYCLSLIVGRYGTTTGSFHVYGTKSRVVRTDNYSERLLYCYETPTPMFGDVGSSTVGEDGLAVVSIDDVFSETIQSGKSYQVFLQECGEGNVYVLDKQPAYFIVKGTPNLKFDWEVKAKQRGFESTRLEDFTISRSQDSGLNETSTKLNSLDGELVETVSEYGSQAEDIGNLYEDVVMELEKMYDEEQAA